MRFERVEKVVAYLLVGTGFLVLFLSDELPVFYWAAVVPAVLGSWVVGGRPAVGSAVLWNTVLVLALATLIAAAVASGDWLSNAIFFASVMVIAKLYQRRGSGDLLQLYALSFLQLVAGAVINPTLSFALCFLMYVVFLTWALLLLHLRRDMERLVLETHEDGDPAGPPETFAGWRMRRLVSPGFLAGTSVLALVIFSFSTVVFLLFPRLGLGFFGQHRQSGERVSGFNSEIELGGFGTLKRDRTIIMRVEIEGATLGEVLPLRLRGITFDRYDGLRWQKSERILWRLAQTEPGGFVGVKQEGRVGPNALRFTQRIYLEQLDIDRKTVFAEARVEAVRDLVNDKYIADYRKHTRFYQDSDLDLIYTSGSALAALRYEVRSVRVPREPAVLRTAGERYPIELEKYMQLPPINPEIVALAKRVTQGKANPYDKVAAIEKHLLFEYGYSLEGGHDPDDPLSDFLFGRKEGHCEYFSTAMVVMARAIGIPARPAGGFFGGELNDVGSYVAIRHADAHSWVEVYFPEHGWIVFDPTPPSGSLVGAGEGFFAQLGRYFDSLQLVWYKWVIRWDLERQLAFLRGIGESLQGLGDIVPDGGISDFGKRLRAALTPRRVAGGVGVLLLIAGWLLRRRLAVLFGRREPVQRVRRGPTSRDKRAARRLFDRLLRYARRRGVEVKESTTPGAVVRAMARLSPYAGEQAALVVRAYEDVIFGAQGLGVAAERRCREHLRNLRRERTA